MRPNAVDVFIIFLHLSEVYGLGIDIKNSCVALNKIRLDGSKNQYITLNKHCYLMSKLEIF